MTSNSPATQPHDTLFRHSMSIPRVAREFLEAWLPDTLLALIDWSTLKIDKINTSDDSLSERREDVLYQIKAAGHPVCFYLLLEHQTNPKPDMVLRLLEYTLLIWRKHHKAGSKQKLPLVIPIVVHPGPNAWTSARRLQDIIEIPEEIAMWAKGFAPDAGYELIELKGLPITKLAAGNLAESIMAALQGQRKGKLPYKQIVKIVELLYHDPTLPEVAQLSRQLWTYLLVHSELKDAEICAIIESTIPKEEQSNFMSTAERLKYEGRQEGRQEELHQVILEALEIRFQRVPLGLREAVEEIMNIEKLRHLHRAAIRCADIEGFAAEL